MCVFWYFYIFSSCFMSLFGCWPQKISNSLASHLAFCALRNLRAIHGSNCNPHCQNTFSPLPHRLCGCSTTSFCRSNTQNPLIPYFNIYSLLPSFYVFSFRVDDASKEAWHIKRYHVPPADLQWQN